MPIRRRQKKRNAGPRQKQKQPHAVINPLVNPGNPPHRHQTRPKADPTRTHHRMVTVAQSSPSSRSALSPQKTATVMLEVPRSCSSPLGRFAFSRSSSIVIDTVLSGASIQGQNKSRMKKLALFIHGLGGTAEGTWQKFPELVRADPELNQQYDVATFEYSSGAFGSKPSFAICAACLKTEIESRYPEYSDVALIAHSQGGLVARYYIAERLNSGQPLKVSRLLERYAMLDETAHRLLEIARRCRRLLVDDLLKSNGVHQRDPLVAVLFAKALKDGAAILLRAFSEPLCESDRLIVA